MATNPKPPTDVAVPETQALALPIEAQYPVLGFDPGELKLLVEENLGEGMTPNLQRVPWPTGGNLTFTIATDEGEKTVPNITGLILYHTDNRLFWVDSFDESGGGQQPDCQSPDGILGFGSPSDPKTGQAHPNYGRTDPDRGYACRSCPLSKFGKDGERPRCRQTHPLFVLPQAESEDDMSMLPIIVSVPPSSLKVFQQYAGRLLQRGISFRSAVTEIGLVQDKGGPGGNIKYSKLDAKRVGRLNPEQLSKIRSYATLLEPMIERFQNQRTAIDAEYPDPSMAEEDVIEVNSVPV